jgi:RNA polymerase sigma factor (sigma-70 family)
MTETSLMKDRETDKAYAKYVAGPGDLTEAELHAVLFAHALRLCWQELKEHRTDLASDACWKAFKNLDGFQGKSKFSTWFHRIVLNTITSAKRLEARLSEVGLEMVGEAAASGGSNPEAHRLFEQLQEGLTAEELVLWQFKLKGVAEGTIATALKLTTEGVRSRWFRLKKKLLKRLS